jgi:hypothetical protein
MCHRELWVSRGRPVSRSRILLVGAECGAVYDLAFVEGEEIEAIDGRHQVVELFAVRLVRVDEDVLNLVLPDLLQVPHRLQPVHQPVIEG